MRLCLVEDHLVAGLEPLTLTRPVHELRLGALTLGQKIQQAFGLGPDPGALGAVVRTHLEAIGRQRDPFTAINSRAWLAAGPLIVANARWVPPAGFRPPETAGPWVGLCEDQPACAFVTEGEAAALTSANAEGWFDEIASRHRSRQIDLGGAWITRPWDLVAANGAHLQRDFPAAGGPHVRDHHLQAMALVGPVDRLRIHDSVRIDPYTVFDTSGGPIIVEADVWVQPFTRIEGPCFIGRGTQLFRANLRGAVSLGPNCRIGGEVESSIIHGYSNKYHEGFLGHAYIGEWVNLGAITSNSDLRNDYGEVFVPLGGDPVSTGRAKVGCFLGDHTRTGLGSMLNTGTVIGVMCNVLPAGPLLPKHVPSFSAVLYGRVAPGFPLEQLFATARTVMGRRGKVFTPAEEQLYTSLYEQTHLERERAFQRANRRRDDNWPLASAFRG
jgi:UDP-N-acetylglucosamine diphosphorylase/glucosamine-1-phosphate N-acetyltransferase